VPKTRNNSIFVNLNKTTRSVSVFDHDLCRMSACCFTSRWSASYTYGCRTGLQGASHLKISDFHVKNC